jgi:tol-pal system protein YbgF
MRLAAFRRLIGSLMLVCLSAGTAVAGLAQDYPLDPRAAAQTPAPSGVGASPQRVFDAARADYYAGQWSLAIQAFETFIKTFGSSDLADDAQYYIGETWYAQRKFKEAVAAYGHLITAYPSSNVLPDAHYKRGLALYSLGQVAEARESFAFVVKDYPSSLAGRLAKMALDRADRNWSVAGKPKPASDQSAEAEGFYLVLLLAHTKPGTAVAGLSEREMNALKDASEFLPYKSYQALDRVLVRGSRTQTVRMQGPSGREYSGTLDVGPVTPPSGQDVYVKVDLTDGQTIGSVLKTEFRIRLGETVVVGTSKVRGTDQALVLLLTALPEVYKPGNGVSMPTLVAEVKPQYTAEARSAKIQGTVIVDCVVLTDGAVGDCRVVRSLDPGLDQQAITSAQQWRFKPGMKEGRPVATRVQIELSFSIRK